MRSLPNPLSTTESIGVLSNPLEPPCAGNPVFTPNDGETGADAALTIIWGALEYFAEPANDADVWGMGEALLHSLDIAGLLSTDRASGRSRDQAGMAGEER